MCEYSHLNTIIGELLETNIKFCSSQGCKWRYGSKVKYISIIIIVHWLLCYDFHTQCQLLMYISLWIQYDVHHPWMKKSLYLMDKIINDQIWYNVSIQYNMLYSSINTHANIIQNCSNVVCNEGTLPNDLDLKYNTCLDLYRLVESGFEPNPIQKLKMANRNNHFRYRNVLCHSHWMAVYSTRASPWVCFPQMSCLNLMVCVICLMRNCKMVVTINVAECLMKIGYL